jgi:crossover junction endodeoxyribonuclease RuvC
MRILGVDPGLQRTGWGVIDVTGNRLVYVGCGVVASKADWALADRLKALHDGLMGVVARFAPQEAAIEETFVTANGVSTLKLGQARGAALVTLALAGLPVAEYAATQVKKSVVGAGRAEKSQMAFMVARLLPGADVKQADATDALAIAITHNSFRKIPSLLS